MATLQSRSVPRAVRWVIGSLVVCILLVVGLALIDWNAVRGPLSRMASRELGRRVTIGGLRVHLFTATPSVNIEHLTIANPDWAGAGNMVELQGLEVAVQLSELLLGHLVLASLEIDGPTVSLLRDGMGRASWDFTKPGQSKPPKRRPTAFPAVRHFALRGGSLEVRDFIRKLTFNGRVIANESGASGDAEPFRLEGNGTLNEEPFTLRFDGDALLNSSLDRPYRFQAMVDAGSSDATARGSIEKPFDFGVIDVDVVVEGQNLANLYYLSNLALPLTPPYRLAARLHRDGDHFALHDIVGKIGSSDIEGSAAVDLVEDRRPKLTAVLSSRSLNLGDLGVALGAGIQHQNNKTGAPQVPAPIAAPMTPLMLPTFEFQFDRLRSMDATVDFRATAVQATNVPFRAVAFKLKLDHSVLVIDPIDFELPLGKLAGQVRLDTTGQLPQAAVDLHITDVHLDQFKGHNATNAPLSGLLQVRMRLQGHGNSVHAIAASGNGTVDAVVAPGEIRDAFAELTGINIVRGLGLLLGKSDQVVPLRCGVVEFQVQDGDARAQRMVFDTQNVLITGDGHITLSDEKLDINIQGHPKEIRLGRLRTPINVRGTLRHPSVGISAPAALTQGGVAAVVGALVTPIAAVLAFIDPGLAKNADCVALTEEAHGRAAHPTSVTDQ